VPAVLAGPFPPTPGPNHAGRFPGKWLSSDYCVDAAAGCPAWMAWWQEVQTTRVFLCMVAMTYAHAGRGCPCLARSASLRTWWVSTGARCSHHSHRPLRSRVVSSLRPVAGTGSRSVRTAFFCRVSGIPPNLATSGFLPARSAVASKQCAARTAWRSWPCTCGPFSSPSSRAWHPAS
jgi:hypothetical protein